MGTLDEEFLKNEKLAKDLCDPIGGRFWAQNEIRSVSCGQTEGEETLGGQQISSHGMIEGSISSSELGKVGALFGLPLGFKLGGVLITPGAHQDIGGEIKYWCDRRMPFQLSKSQNSG